MSLEHILLGMLREPASGYELRKDFDSGPRHFWSARLSQIYPTLQRMEERGWLISRSKPSAQGPARRVYQRTKAGTRALHEWLRAEPDVSAERLAYIGQLVFMSELNDLAQTRTLLERLRERFTSRASLLRKAQAGMGRSPATLQRLDDDAFHELLCLRMGIQSLRGKIAACDQALSLIRAHQSPRRHRKGSSHA